MTGEKRSKEVRTETRRRKRSRGRAGSVRSAAAIVLSAAVTVGTMLCLSGFTGAKIPRVRPSGYYRVITVDTDDSLWDIAQEYCGLHDRDIRRTIREIMEVNGLSSSLIYPGQKLSVPYQP